MSAFLDSHKSGKAVLCNIGRLFYSPDFPSQMKQFSLNVRSLLVLLMLLAGSQVGFAAVAGTSGQIHSLERTTLDSADSAPSHDRLFGKIRQKAACRAQKRSSPGGLGLAASILGTIFLGIGIASFGTTIGGLMLILGTGLALTAVVLGIVSLVRHKNDPNLDRKSGIIGMFIATAPFAILLSWLIYILIINPFG